MLRITATSLRRVQTQFPRQARSITSKQKRALAKEQIGGEKTAKPPTKTATPPPPPSAGGGGGGSSLPIFAGLAVVGVGGAYYMDLIPKDLIPSMGEEKVSDAAATPKKEAAVPVVAKEEKKEEPKVEKTVVKKEAKKEKVVEKSEGNRVRNIQAPPTANRVSEAVPTVGHLEGGNRVTLEKMNGGKDTVDEVVVTKKDDPTGAVAVEAEKELTASLVESSKIDEELAKAHAQMKATVTEAYLKDLDSLSASELRVRIVQLSTEMNERAKWEAVRLREFLAMKEKEVGEKYMETMQKQRFEFEDLLARRLREQEGTITKAANDALEKKDKSIQAVIDAATSAQQAEYEEALKSNTELLQSSLSARYESQFATKLAEEKANFVKDLNEMVAEIDDFKNRLQQAEQNLQISRNFESGSQRAHRVSAAALAFAEKMESNKGAGEELAALKAAAVESGVIASALEKIPSTIKNGIPTLPELQANFDDVHKVGREAAYVPVGRSGIGAQLAGKVFASVAVQPSPDTTSPPVDDEGKTADYILACAKRHVKLGELEQAISALDQLKGQSAFTVKAWKSAAMDRVAVEKALKVIKMECALLNKTMSG